MDDPASRAAYVASLPKDAERPAPETTIDTAGYLAWLANEDAAQPPAVHRVPTRADALARAVQLEAAARGFLKGQLPSGVTVHRGRGTAGIGATAYPREAALGTVLRYVENARMALGELPLAYRGGGQLLDAAYPEPDWYDTPLRTGQ